MLIILSISLLTNQIAPNSPLHQIHDRWKVNIICDTTSSDAVTRINADNADDAINKFANQTSRRIEKLNNIYILRKKSYIEPKHTINSAKIIDNYQFIIHNPTISLIQTFRFVSENCTVNSISRAFKEKGYQLKHEGNLSTRSVQIYIENKTLPEIVEALAYCINATPEIVLRQTPAQIELETLGIPDAFAARYLASRSLYDQVESLLTPEQKAARASGTFVELPFQQLPIELRSSAENYLKIAYAQSQVSIPGVIPEPNWGASGSFALRFPPPGNGPIGLLGALIRTSDGHEYCF